MGKVGFLFDFNGAQERLKLFNADLMVESSFDEAVQGVYGVFHIASPVLVRYDEHVQVKLETLKRLFSNVSFNKLTQLVCTQIEIEI